MREIKFLAQNLKGDWVTFTLEGLMHFYGDPFCFEKFKNWRQYTGLKDKNGREIYEGDLLRFKDNNLAHYEVFYNDNLAKFDCCRTHYKLPQCGGMIFPIETIGYEVIGNIYENPELLK